MNVLRRLIVLFAGAGLLCSCGSDSEARIFDVTGTVLKISTPELVIIDHDEIPGFMEAMRMPFKTENADTLEGIEEGQRVRFEYVVPEGRPSFLRKIEVIP